MKIHPRLARTLYRSYLRASHHGQYPQVFGYYGASVFSQQAVQAKEHAPLALPSSPWQVRQRLKQCFRDNESITSTTTISSNPLDVLRHVHEQEAILLPTTNTTNTTNNTMLPIFDYGELAALPGERVQTLFLEPRYIHGLLPSVIHNSVAPQFLLRPSPNSSIATLVHLEWHQPVLLPANATGTTMGSVSTNDKDNKKDNEENMPLYPKIIPGVAVALVAGSRVHIRHQEYQSPDTEMMKNQHLGHAITCMNTDTTGEEKKKASENDHCWSTSAAPLAWAMEYSHLHDQDYVPPHKLEYNNRTPAKSNNNNHHHAWLLETRQYILHMLHVVLDYHGSELAETLVHTKYGLPPLDPEAFSFWALKFVLKPNDMPGRLEWLQGCQSTQQRLQFIVQQVEEISDAQWQDQQQKQKEQDDEQESLYYETTRFG